MTKLNNFNPILINGFDKLNERNDTLYNSCDMLIMLRQKPRLFTETVKFLEGQMKRYYNTKLQSIDYDKTDLTKPIPVKEINNDKKIIAESEIPLLVIKSETKKQKNNLQKCPHCKYETRFSLKRHLENSHSDKPLTEFIKPIEKEVYRTIETNEIAQNPIKTIIKNQALSKNAYEINDNTKKELEKKRMSIQSLNLNALLQLSQLKKHYPKNQTIKQLKEISRHNGKEYIPIYIGFEQEYAIKLLHTLRKNSQKYRIHPKSEYWLKKLHQTLYVIRYNRKT